MSNEEIKEYREWCEERGYHEVELEAIKTFLRERYERKLNVKTKD